MIPVLRLAQSLRFALKDMQAATVSDYELIEVINQAASLLYVQMSEKFVQYGLKKTVIITENEGQASLPTDFIKVHQVLNDYGETMIPSTVRATCEGTYRIMGTVFNAPEGAYSLEYYYVPLRVKSLSDELDAPEAMTSYIEQISLALYGNNLEKAQSIVNQCVQSLGLRELSHFNNVGPVQVLGGRI